MATFLQWGLLLAIVSTHEALADSPPPKVYIGSGTLVGRFWQTRNNRTVEGYQGIPYGKPPIGELRFEPPQPAEPWSGERMADKMPPVCMQNNTDFGPDSEDCLYLNVFTINATAQELLPVLVWVFGSGFEAGGISTYTPEYFLDEDIVLVAIQYRVGFFGFLSTNDEVAPGNQGVKDVRLGLRWVKDNIHYFGGDPEKVTISGNSAGGALVHALMVFSAHEGLFRAGMTPSGSNSFTSLAFKPPRHVSSMLPLIANMTSCPLDSVGLVQCLKRKPASDLVQLYEDYKSRKFTQISAARRFPALGLVLEPDCALDRIVSDNPWNMPVTIPWIASVNGLEGAFWIYSLLEDRWDVLFSLTNTYFDEITYKWMDYANSDVDFAGVTEAIRSFYLNNRPISRDTYLELAQIVSDALVIYGSYEGIQRSNLSTTFVYVNEYVGDQLVHTTGVPRKNLLGPDHSGDHHVFFFPDPLKIATDRVYSPSDEIVSKRLLKLMGNFITNLNPSSSEIEWKSFGQEELYLNLTLESFTMNSGFFTERMRFWQKLAFPFKGETLGPLLCSSFY